MPVCPQCRDEYASGQEVCVTCRVALLPDDSDLPPQVDRVLGVFHPAAAEVVVALVQRREVAHDVRALGEDRVKVWVDRDFRDDLRAELAVNWPGVVNSLEPEQRAAVLASGPGGGTQPGWFDAPVGAWVDREGRLQVDPGVDEQDMAEASRMWGPTLLTVGAVLLLLGWYASGGAAFVVVGLVLVGLGLFLPR